MPGPKTNEAPVRLRKGGQRGTGEAGSRAVARYVRTSPYKVREVLDLIRGVDVTEAASVLRFCERDAAITVGKLLKSAVSNAEANEQLAAEELYVSACFCDEGPTIKRWRPRARGRVNRIRKRTSHVTVVVTRMPDQAVARVRARTAQAAANRAARVAAARGTAEEATAVRRRAAAGVEETVAGATLTDTEVPSVTEPTADDALVVEAVVEPEASDEATIETAADETATDETATGTDDTNPSGNA